MTAPKYLDEQRFRSAEAAAPPADLTSVIDLMASYIGSTADVERRDRLWPAHFSVFLTNPLSVAYGACGIALFLQRASGSVPDVVKTWLLAQPVKTEDYPPGLFLGTSGIAYTLAELGLLERAREVMRETYRSPLLYEEPGMFLGVAGWGSISLYLWDRTRDHEHLDRAVQAGEFLVGSAATEDHTCYWPVASEGRVHYGFGYGASGIALFLLRLWERTGDSVFRDCAERALEYDLNHKLLTVNGITWMRFEHDLINYPYFVHGAAGVGAVVVRFADACKTERYLSLGRDIADAIDMKWTVDIGLLHGLSGIGELQVDMYRLTGERRYLERARDMAATILWYGMPMPTGMAFPGRRQLKIANDLATGAAGVGLFLHRVQHAEPRCLVDLEGEHPTPQLSIEKVVGREGDGNAEAYSAGRLD